MCISPLSAGKLFYLCPWPLIGDGATALRRDWRHSLSLQQPQVSGCRPRARRSPRATTRPLPARSGYRLALNQKQLVGRLPSLPGAVFVRSPSLLACSVIRLSMRYPSGVAFNYPQVFESGGLFKVADDKFAACRRGLARSCRNLIELNRGPGGLMGIAPWAAW